MENAATTQSFEVLQKMHQSCYDSRENVLRRVSFIEDECREQRTQLQSLARISKLEDDVQRLGTQIEGWTSKVDDAIMALIEVVHTVAPRQMAMHKQIFKRMLQEHEKPRGVEIQGGAS